MADVAKAKQFHPYIVVKTEEEDSAISLATDGQIVTAVPLENVPFTVMAAYFTYNICYPKGTINFFYVYGNCYPGIPSGKGCSLS